MSINPKTLEYIFVCQNQIQDPENPNDPEKKIACGHTLKHPYTSDATEVKAWIEAHNSENTEVVTTNEIAVKVTAMEDVLAELQ